MARALWFGSYWGVKIEELWFENQNQLVEFIINPPKSLLVDQEQRSCFTLYGALLMDLIWKMTNKVVHEGQTVSIADLRRGIIRLFFERLSMVKDMTLKLNNRHNPRWSKPNQGCIKINCDAAIGNSHSVLAIVARDWRGNLLFAHSKKGHTNIPVQAEAEALRWVIRVAFHCNIQKLIIEGDSKVCIEAISKDGAKIP